jgi:hypothetical protein
MGLTAWIAFSFSFVFVNGSYAISVLSDPFGWGWNLVGTKDFPWIPLWPEIAAALQLATLLIGLVFSSTIAFRISRQHTKRDELAWRGSLPLIFFLTGVTLLFVKLYLG